MTGQHFTLTFIIVLALFCSAVQAMKPAAARTLPPHDKFITQVRIDGTQMPDFQRIYFMPYTGGPRMGVQEVAGVTLNGIQDYASAQMRKGKWKPPLTLIYKVEKPILINVTTHNPELTVVLEMLDESSKLWTFNNSDKFKKEHFQKKTFEESIGEFNELSINLGATKDPQQVVIRPI